MRFLRGKRVRPDSFERTELSTPGVKDAPFGIDFAAWRTTKEKV
jgi:hypothetical protein